LNVYLLTQPTAEGELIYQSRFAIGTKRATRLSTPIYEGLPYILGAKTSDELYVVVSREYAQQPENERSAWALYNELKREAARAPSPLVFISALFEKLQQVDDVNHSRGDRWSLMFALWVRALKPQSYLTEGVDLGTALITDLIGPVQLDQIARGKLLDLQRHIFGNVSELVFPRLPGLAQPFWVVNTVADRNLVTEMIAASEHRLLGMLAATLASQSMARALMMLSALLPAVTQFLLLDFLVQALIGFVEVANELKDAEAEEIKEAEIVKGVYWPGAGIFLPFLTRVPIVGVSISLWGLYELIRSFIEYLVYALSEIVGSAERTKDASEAGFSDYEENDPDFGLLIPNE
jgi:hypothetical protein